jgi:DNA-binding response OmpR family regulator
MYIMRLLLVEDQVDLIENIRDFFVLEKYVVDMAYDGEAGLKQALSETYDCIILDLNLPKMDGEEVCRKLREAGSNVPVLMLTARTGTPNIVAGLDTGADDYLLKPFNFDELYARVRTLTRRKIDSRNPVVSFRDLSVDTNIKKVFREGKEIELAPKEYLLFEYLLMNRGEIQSRTKLIEHVWGEYDDLIFSQTVDVHIAYLRKKIGKSYIETGKGGYYIPKE